MTDDPGAFAQQPDATPEEAVDEPFARQPVLPEPGAGGTAEAEGASKVAEAAAPMEVPSAADEPGEAAPPDAVASPPGEQGARSMDGELARLHLRTGMLALARAELETLAGWSALDREALVDLAEVRWRTGDLIGAGEAAAAYLEVGGDDAIAFCVAAEAALATGRKHDAETYAARALDRATGRLDDLFAGQPRSDLWPEPLARPVPTARRSAPSAPAVWPPPSGEIEPAASLASAAPDGAPDGSAPVGIADAGTTVAAQAPVGAPAEAPSSAGAQAELVEAERRVTAGEMGGLAPRLEIVLRLQPALAPAVLSLADAALRAAAPRDGGSGDAAPRADELAAINLVRSDACRLMGREALSAAALQEARRLLQDHTPPQEPT